MANVKISALPSGSPDSASVLAGVQGGITVKIPVSGITQQDATGLPIFNTAWAAQDTWFIDPVGGNDANSGIDLAHALQTWTELRRRMTAVNGHTAPSTTITIQSDLPNTDIMMVDWGTATTFNVINVVGVTSVIRSGTFTATTSRDPTTNQPTVIEDTAIVDWTPDLGVASGRQIVVTSGAATGYPSWVAKDLGSHQARVSPFIDVGSYAEITPSAGDTYDVVARPSIPNYSFCPKNGTWNVSNLNLADNNSAAYGLGYTDFVTAVLFTNCAIWGVFPAHTTTYLTNCCIKNTLQAFGAQVQVYAGLIGDLIGNLFAEVEDACDILLDIGVLIQGIRTSVINGGYIRIYDAQAFDAPDYAFGINENGVMRVDELAGSNNSTTGIYLGGSGKLFGNFTACYITGLGGDVSFIGRAMSWAELATNGYTRAFNSSAEAGPVDESSGEIEGGRILGRIANITAANDLTLGNANQNIVAGNTQINAVTITDWTAGVIVTLVFTGTPTVKHNTAGGLNTAKIFLSGSTDFVASNNSVLQLVYDGTQWQEIARKVP
jgi:hypothetical protein